MAITSRRAVRSAGPRGVPTHPLNGREERTLLAVVEAHVATTLPVGSRALTRVPGETLSSASIRATLARLERAGLVYRPHASAGRVPTDTGYRYYVDRLLDEGSVAESVGGDGVRSVDTTPAGVARRLATACGALVIAAGADGDARVAGLRFILEPPEFDRAARLGPLFELLDSPRDLRSVLVDGENGVRVRIGREHGHAALADHSTITCSWTGEHSMTVIVVGPTRIDYRAVLQRVADLRKRIER